MKKLQIILICILLVVLLAVIGIMVYKMPVVKADHKTELKLGDDLQTVWQYPNAGRNSKTGNGEMKDKLWYENTTSYNIFIRAELIYEPEDMGDNASVDLGKNWVEKDGYLYYAKALKPGEKTTEVIVKLEGLTDTEVDNGAVYMEATSICAGDDTGSTYVNAWKKWKKPSE